MVDNIKICYKLYFSQTVEFYQPITKESVMESLLCRCPNCGAKILVKTSSGANVEIKAVLPAPTMTREITNPVTVHGYDIDDLNSPDLGGSD